MSARGEASRARAKSPLAPDDHRHGTVNGYTNYGCRCDRCCRAHTIWHGAYMETRAVALGPCSVPGCDRGQYAKGLCQVHYERKRTRGDVGPSVIANQPSARDRELRCFSCGEWLPDAFFARNVNASARRGRAGWCTTCQSDYQRERRAHMSEEQRAVVRERDRRRKAAERSRAVGETSTASKDGSAVSCPGGSSS